jgi:lysozyme
MIQFIAVWLIVFAIIFNSVQEHPEQPFEWVSDSTLQLIENFEGKRHRAYRDSQGNWTIGVGHLIKRETRHLLHTELSEEQVMGILHQDLEKCSTALQTALSVPVTRLQADAMHSLCHNIGPDNMRRSEVVKHLNAGDPDKAAKAFMNWSNPPELRKRRAAEKALFLAGT